MFFLLVLNCISNFTPIYKIKIFPPTILRISVIPLFFYLFDVLSCLGDDFFAGFFVAVHFAYPNDLLVSHGTEDKEIVIAGCFSYFEIFFIHGIHFHGNDFSQANLFDFVLGSGK